MIERVRIAVLILATGIAACATRSAARADHPTQKAALPSSAHVFVMAPTIVGTAAPGNVGRDFVAIRAEVARRILAAVRNRFPDAELAPGGEPAPPEATHLVVPVITEWKEMRADDPLGVLFLPHDSVTITLRLVRRDPSATIGEITFHNRGRLTLNRGAARLLDDSFRHAVLQLLGA